MRNNTQWRHWGEGAAPCKGCTERTAEPNCHGQNEDGSYRCKRYADFKDQRDQELNVRREFIRQSDEVEAVMRGGKRKK